MPIELIPYLIIGGAFQVFVQVYYIIEAYNNQTINQRLKRFFIILIALTNSIGATIYLLTTMRYQTDKEKSAVMQKRAISLLLILLFQLITIQPLVTSEGVEGRVIQLLTPLMFFFILLSEWLHYKKHKWLPISHSLLYINAFILHLMMPIETVELLIIIATILWLNHLSFTRLSIWMRFFFLGFILSISVKIFGVSPVDLVDEAISYIYLNMIFYVLMVLAFYVIKKQQHTMTLLEEANTLLTEQAKTIKKMSALEEREKMAKSIHDHVGHTLTTAILTLEGLKQQKDLSTIINQVEISKNQVKKSLDDIRSLVRETPYTLDLIPLIESFIESMRSQTPLTIHFEHTVHSSDFLPLQKELILSIIKEAFTNTLKYAEATEVDILIQEIEHTLIINFTDNGIGCVGLTCGFGLNSMQKAIHQFNGSVHFESEKDEGFSIQVKLPLGGSL